jgi:hypothetical protein
VAAKALESLGISHEAVRQKVEETIGAAGTAPSGSPPFTPRAKKVLELSLREALQLGHSYIGTEHILIGLVREGEGVAAHILVGLGADLHRVRQQVIQLTSGSQGPDSPGSASLPRRRGSRLVACSFCGRFPADDRRLVAGGDAFICEYCVREWAQRLSEGEGEGEGDVGTPSAHLFRPSVEPDEAQDDGESE